ncbi:ATP-binding cassette sub- A member 3 [Schistosoma haematobium]|uniref:ATP-binding cassette sub- A member 3 n=1 Tax=Schistosoma haematobium TaxID=6185 RepID=A0A922S052_SCHHA|nr:ATP-binding cassette sub- A member 3 [Schistosoma haematobium]KAH9587678.1 ATP-binding cassette sub- A member 3 [Schistosoma haematobium]
MLPPSTSTETVFLKPRAPFKLTAFNERTLMQVGQPIGLTMSLKSLNIDVCCLFETRIQDSGEVLQIRSPSVASKSLFYVRLSGDPVACSSGLAGVGVAPSARDEAALIDWIPINSRLCAVRLESSIKVRRNGREKRCVFVISAYAPTDYSPDAIKDEFYHQLSILQKVRSTDIVVLAGDLNAQVGRLGTEESRLGGRWGIVDRRTDNRDRLLQLCTNHNLFLASTNFRHSHRRCATWRPPSASQAWTQINHIAISYRSRGCVQDCRSFWSTYLDCDHALVCTNLTLLFSGQRSDRHQRIGVSKLVATFFASKYRIELASRLATIPPKSIDEHWSQLHDAMKMVGAVSYGFAKRPAYKHWVSSGSLQLIEARRSTPGDREFDHKRRMLRNEIGQSLRKDREAWWSKRANELEAAAASGNYRKLFQLIRATGSKKSGVSETICEDDGRPITNIHRRLGRCAEFFEGQFNWPAAPATSVRLFCLPWPVTTNPLNEAEVRKELHLKRYKSPGPDDLPPATFKDGGDFVTKELTTLFTKVWELESVSTSWNESIVVPIFKKGSRRSCNNYRAISLLPIASKLLASVILRRLFKTRERLAREEQAGFRSGRGCIDHISTLRQMLEHRHTYQRPTIVVFLDIRVAFDSLNRTVLWDCLLKKGVPEKFINTLKALYTNTSGRVRAYNHLSPLFHSSSGVRQGCRISPFLFNFAIDDILETALMDVSNGGVDLLPGERLLDIEYAIMPKPYNPPLISRQSMSVGMICALHLRSAKYFYKTGRILILYPP